MVLQQTASSRPTEISRERPDASRWAYGFWQCRERYTSGAQLVETVKEFRKRKIPLDVIVQDWQYWGKNGWAFHSLTQPIILIHQVLLESCTI